MSGSVKNAKHNAIKPPLTNPLTSLERNRAIRAAIASDIEQIMQTRKSLQANIAFYSFTKFIWRVGTKTVTMPTVKIEEQNRG